MPQDGARRTTRTSPDAGADGHARAPAPDWDGVDRRSKNQLRLPPELERRSPTGLERHRGPGRRLSTFTKAAEDGEMTREQFLFLRAMDEFKRVNGKPYPAWSDVLEVVRLLGYRKTQPSELRIAAAEDFREKPDAPAGVRPQRWSERHERARREADAPDLNLEDFGLRPERDAA